MLQHLDSIKHAPVLSFDKSIESTLDDLEKQFKSTTIDLSVPMTLSPMIEERLKVEYTENMDLYIQQWQEEAIERLRRQIEANSAEGFRSERMASIIQAEYGVSQNKAKFLARQETSLLVSKYRQSRYQEAGISRYRWSTSHDERVRHDHKLLAGQVFSWDSPPVVDLATGRRAHPGEDFNCRCIAVPIVRLR